jgi:hypothetical protein
VLVDALGRGRSPRFGTRFGTRLREADDALLAERDAHPRRDVDAARRERGADERVERQRGAVVVVPGSGIGGATAVVAVPPE